MGESIGILVSESIGWLMGESLEGESIGGLVGEPIGWLGLWENPSGDEGDE